MAVSYIVVCWELFIKVISSAREVDQGMLLWIERVSLHRCGICVQLEHSHKVANLREKS